MAEAVGLAASVLTLAQTGWKVAKGLYDLADEVGSAGEAVRIFANDFWLFVETVKTLGDLFYNLPPASTRIHSMTEELLDVAMEQVVNPFQNMVVQLEPLLVKWRDSPSRMTQLGTRLQWAFSYKSRVLFYHSALNALKGNISLLLQAVALRGQNPPHIHFILCKSIDDTKTVLQDGSRKRVSKLLSAKNNGTIDGHLVTPDTEKLSDSRSMVIAIPSRTRSKSQDQRQLSAETAMVHDTDIDDSIDADEITEDLSRVTLLEPDYIDSLEQDQEETEVQLEVFGAIRAVQKKVFRLADEARTSAGPAPNQNQKDKNIGIRKLPTGTSKESSTLLSQPEGTVSQQMPNTGAAQKQTDKFAPKRTTNPKVRKEPKPIEKGNGVVFFEDSLNSRFEIACDYIRTWQAMHAFLVAEYKQVSPELLHSCYDAKEDLSDIQTLIREGHYTIVQVDAEPVSTVVMPYEWESRVKPGWTIQLHLDYRYLNEVTILKDHAEPSFGRIRLAQMAAAATGVLGHASRPRPSTSEVRSGLVPSSQPQERHKRSSSRRTRQLEYEP